MKIVSIFLKILVQHKVEDAENILVEPSVEYWKNVALVVAIVVNINNT